MKKFGREHAQAVWDAGMAAAFQIRDIVDAEQIKCELCAVPGYLFAAADKDAEAEGESLHREAHLAAELGFDADFTPSAEVVQRPAIRFANLMKFHPGKYVAGLARRIPGKGCHVFEESNVESFAEEPRRISCNGHTVRYGQVFIATHVPLQGSTSTLPAALFQTKLAGYSTYAMRARLPSRGLHEALFWDTSDPYLYIRIDQGKDADHVVIGGEDHKTGQETDTEECYEKLKATLLAYFPGAKVIERWSGQVIETVDGLPYIGETAEKQFVATGFSGTGMTFGTLGAMMFADSVLGATNPWSQLFAVERKELSATWNYLVENKDYPYYLVKDKLTGAQEKRAESLLPEEARILNIKGEKVAAYRNDKGELSTCSAVCPHMGCIVVWNPAESTWDCPCHGSRFGGDGAVIAGPAETPLKPVAQES